MPLLFGGGFRAAATPFTLLSISAGLVVVQACVTEAVLMSLDSQRYYVGLLALALPVMLCTQAVLVSQFGVDGAACAAIVCDLYLAIGGVVGVTRKLGKIRLDRSIIARGSLSVLAMAAAMLAAREVGLAVEMGAGGLTFVAASWASGLRITFRPANV